MTNLSLNIGLNALLTAQNALDTVGHNIANANTPGYSRQRLYISASRPMQRGNLIFGRGVQADSVKRTVDDLINVRLVKQISSISKLESMISGMSELEAILGEPAGFGIGGLIDEFFQSVATLSANPDDLVLRTGVTQAVGSKLTAQFHSLSANLDRLRSDSSDRVESSVKQVNVLTTQVVNLNLEIAKIEAGGVVANDLRDQREVLLRTLAEQVDISFMETPEGAVRVLLDGQLLVSPARAQQLYTQRNAAGDVTVLITGGTSSVDVGGGRIGGLIGLSSDFVPSMKKTLDKLAYNMIFEFNRVHSTGIPSAGGFTSLSGTSSILDMDGDGSILDERLDNSGLPFSLQEGTLYVNVSSISDGDVLTTPIEIDPLRTTVASFLEAINSVDHVSANLDTFGRLQIFADSGFRFDFGQRLVEHPDKIGSFGGKNASIGSGVSGPFELVSGDTLILNGPAGATTVAFNVSDFVDIAQATAAEVAAVINTTDGITANGMYASVVGDQLVLQSLSEGASATFDVTAGTALDALGWTAGTTVTGHNTAIEVKISGTYDGKGNDLFTFTPTIDGEIGTTPGLEIEVRDTAGILVATLSVGEGYQPGTSVEVQEGIFASFSFGNVSATHNDSFIEHVLDDSDTSDVLVALGVNAFFEGTDSASMELRQALADNPNLLATSIDGALGGNGALLEMLSLQFAEIEGLNGSFGGYYGTIVGDVGFRINSAENSLSVESFLKDSLDATRQETSGVNVDEELVNMIQFEQAFGAAARYIEVVRALGDELLRMI